jgi:hypothetical protein
MIKTKQKKHQAKQPQRQKAPAPVSKSRALTTIPKATSKQLGKAIDLAADSHMGMEHMTQADYAIPRIVILQDLSPQVQQRDERHIENAEPGDICDIVGQVLYDGNEGIIVDPVSYRRAYIEWVPRTKGGGFVQDHTPTNPQAANLLQDFLSKCDRGAKGEITTPKGNEIRISGEYFVFMIDKDTGDFQPFVITMGGTQMKKSRRWNTVMNQFKIDYNGERINPAMFYRCYKLTTIPERNDQGSWFGWQITPDVNVIELPKGEQIYLEAKEFRKSIAAGKVSVSQPVQEDVPGAESEDAPM